MDLYDFSKSHHVGQFEPNTKNTFKCRFTQSENLIKKNNTYIANDIGVKPNNRVKIYTKYKNLKRKRKKN